MLSDMCSAVPILPNYMLRWMPVHRWGSNLCYFSPIAPPL